MRNVLITGGCGFAGHHLVEHILETTDWNIVVLDSLTYAGRSERLTDIEGFDVDRAHILWHDLRAPLPEHHLLEDITDVLHLAAESHVDRSIADPVPFVTNNVLATLNLCEWARRRSLDHFVQISTDEVYGPAAEGHAHAEWEPVIPSNPYSASKAAQEAIAISYWRTYALPVVITNTMNLYGERQHIEKFVPMLIKKILLGEQVTLHAQRLSAGEWEPSSRHWLHARNHADALCWILNQPRVLYPVTDRPDRWHIAGEERDVLCMASSVAEILNRPLRIQWVDYHSSRPGHDHRYALDSSKIHAAGWKPPLSLGDSLERTVLWMMRNGRWLER